jgi:diguanylate cyclase (GGDEF)-like protein/PAS domain S-box-containing protein
LIVEDEALIARDLATTVETFGHIVVGLVDSGVAALALATDQRPDIVLMDIHLAGPLDGIAVAQQLGTQLHIPVIYLTAHADGETMRRAAPTHPVGYLLKPFDERTLWSVLEMAAHQHELERRLQTSEARFAATLHSIGDAVLVTDLAGQIIFANGVATQLLGLALDDLVGYELDAALVLVDAATHQPVPSLTTQVLASGALVHLTTPTLLLAHDGRVWPIEDTAAPIRDDGGTLIGVVMVLREISARRAAEAAQRQAEVALRESNAHLAIALRVQERRTADLTILGDLGKALTNCTTLEEGYAVVAHAAQQLFPEVTGVLFVARHTPPALEPLIIWGPTSHPYPILHAVNCRVLREQQIFVGAEMCGGCRCELLGPAHSSDALCVPLSVGDEILGVLHVHLATTDVVDPTGIVQRQLALAFGEQAALGLANLRLRSVLHEQAIRDPLTGLFNRRYLEEILLRELHRAMRDRYPVGVIMLDVDHFKQVNDTYGHDAGDTVLRMLGTLLLGSVRAGDVVCRYGGEEFVLILPTAPLAVVTERAEAVRHEVSTLTIRHNDLVLPRITVSLGASLVRNPQASVSEALARADAALYAAKRAGRNRVVSDG